MTEYITPIVMFLIILICLIKKAPLYSLVTEGAEDGLKIAFGILPTLIMMLSATAMLKESGALDFFINLLTPLTKIFNIPEEVMPMVLLRPISGSGAFGVLSDIFMRFGADSRAGLLASVIMCSTETTFYTMSVYFKATKVKRLTKAVICAVIGDITGILVACLIV